MNEQLRNFDLASFQKASEQMIATNDNAYKGRWNTHNYSIDRIKSYTLEEIEGIIESGSITAQQKLSRNYFYKDGFYRQIIVHYATLLKYAGLLIPNPGFGKQLSTPHIAKKYYSAMDFVDKVNAPIYFTECALRALMDGCYYGVITQINKTNFSYLDLPCGYCRSNFKDEYGNDLIEFDVSYFNTIPDGQYRQMALNAYPDVISNFYRRWSKAKEDTNWVVIPSDIGICFPMFDGRPLFLNVIPATIEYDKAIEKEQEKDAEEIRKIIVQQIPHLTDGRLLFEPDEAEEIHKGTVGMMKNNPNVSVLTTYADVESITSSNSAETVNSTLERMLNNIYSQAGVSGQLFASTGSTTLGTSLQNDMALMMYLAHKFAKFMSNKVNEIFGNSNITFDYVILPVSYYNEDKYVEEAFKLANSGYSWLVPAIAMGLSQRELGNIKDLENDVLMLGDKLRPLSSAYTQSGDGTATSSGTVGRPKLAQEDKSEKTIQNEESLDNTGGGSN